MAAAPLEWRLTQAMPLGLGSSSHGLTAPGGRGVAVQLSRQVSRARVGNLDFEIHVSDVVGLDGRLLHQQVVLQAVQQDQEREMLQYISEAEEEGLSQGPSQSSSAAAGHSASLQHAPPPLALRLSGPLHTHVQGSPTISGSHRAALLSPFQFHHHASLKSPQHSQSHHTPLQSAPSLLRHSLSRTPSLGWSAFLPSFGSNDLATPAPGLALTRTPTLQRTLSVARRSFLRMSSTLGRTASMCMRSGAGSPVQSHALAAAPSLAGAVGVVAMLQHAWETAAQRAAADAALTSTTLLSTGRVMEEAGGALSGALLSLVEVSTTLDTVTHTLHVAGAADAAGAVHTVVGAVSAAGAALSAAGGALQAVGRWGLQHAGAADSGTREVVHTVEAVKGAVESVDGAVQSFGSVVSTLGGMAGAATGATGGAATAGAAAAAAAASSAVSAAAQAAAVSAAHAATVTTAAAAASNAAAVAATSSSAAGAGNLLPALPGLAAVGQVMGTAGALKAAVDTVPSAVGGLVEGLHQAADALHATSEALNKLEHDSLQAAADKMRSCSKVLRSAGGRIQRAQDAASTAINAISQHTAAEVGVSVGTLAKGGQVSMASLRVRVGEVVSDHATRLVRQLHSLVTRWSERSEGSLDPALSLRSP